MVVMLLLVALTAVMNFIIASRGCTSDKDFARMFILVPLIAIGCWACLLVVMSYHMFAVKVMLEGNDRGQESRPMILMLLLATQRVLGLSESGGGPEKCGENGNLQHLCVARPF